MEKIPLTLKQQSLYDYLELYFKEYDYMPTIQDIIEGKVKEEKVLKFRGNGNIADMLERIEKKGWIKRNRGKHRAIKLL